LGSPTPLPTPGPYYFPKHPSDVPAPLGLAQGTLEVRGSCLYLGRDLLIWPDDYQIAMVDGVGAVVGEGWVAFPGQDVALGGGHYELARELPSGARSLTGVPCPGPYMWVAGIVSVEESSSR
jgi:hypothetical protein